MRARRARALLFLLFLGLLGGCATVKPYQRGYLADRIMRYDADAREEAREGKWFEAREGSSGGTGGAGGGCACN